MRVRFNVTRVRTGDRVNTEWIWMAVIHGATWWTCWMVVESVVKWRMVVISTTQTMSTVRSMIEFVWRMVVMWSICRDMVGVIRRGIVWWRGWKMSWVRWGKMRIMVMRYI